MAVMEGAVAPDFQLCRDGRAVSLRDLRGQPVVLAFFPDEWDPSRGEQIGFYEQVLRELPGEPDVQSTPLLRPDEGVAAQYGVKGEQAVFVVDEEGVIRWKHVAPL